ncbi:MAG: arabinan endo-1,5-alpha-L-arabinosidase [Steroidobacteraceae bacterium]
MTDFTRRQLLKTSIAVAGALCAPRLLGAENSAHTLNDRLTGYLGQLHDPVIIKEGGTYHVFGSGGWNKRAQISWRTSTDLARWTNNGDPFTEVPKWAFDAIPGATSMWAPDISYFEGQYRLYYSVSTGGSMRSVTGLATTPTLDKSSPKYRWTDHGLVVETFQGGSYNCIDSNLVIDLAGKHWLAFGSYWSGIKLIPIDPVTGKRPKGDDSIHSIAYRPAPEGGDNPIEGAFIFTHGDYHYLFASYDYCCRKLASNYYVAVGRSKSVLGPYVGRDGKSMMDGYGTSVIVERPWGSTRWRGPGHCGLMHDGARDLIVYHAYDAEKDAEPTLRIAELVWDDAGWPSARGEAVRANNRQ